MTLARSRSAEARLVERAKIILACLDGKRNDAVSRGLGVLPNTVGLWRKRFAARGMAGLRDQPRPGKKPRYGAALRLRILRQLELPPPPGLAGWDGGTLAAALGVSDTRFGGCCAKKAFSCAGIARGASVPTRSLLRKRPILSACTCTPPGMCLWSTLMKNRRTRPWGGR